MRQLLTCAVVLACGCAHRRTASDSGHAVLELESAHYVLLTDLPERDAGKTLGHLENVRGALIQGSWHGDALPREKLRVIQLASSARFHEFASSGMSAFYQPVDLFGEPMLVMTADQGAAGDAILQHELAHALHGSFLPRNPRWFFEGLACYLETLRYDAAADRYLIGEPDEDRLHYLRLHPATDYARVLSTSTREAVLLSGQDGYAFQSAAWLLVFYLANERGAALDDYIQRRARGEPAQAAFNAAFTGLDPGALAQDAAAYEKIMKTAAGGRNRPVYRLREVRLPAWEGAVQVRATSPAEVEALRAELYFLSPGLPRNEAHLAEARAAADAALRLDPFQPLALAVQVALAETSESPLPLESIRSAAERRRDDFRAQMLLAFAVGPQRPDERRAALLRAAELSPQNVTVLNALAWHDLTHGRAPEAIPVAQKAAELAPGRAAVLDTLACALALSARCAEATRVEERAVELASEHASADLRRSLLARLDAMRDGCGAVPLGEE